MVSLVKDIDKCSNNLRSQDQFLSVGSPILRSNSSSHYQQRSTSSTVFKSQETYSTPTKLQFIRSSSCRNDDEN